MHRVLFQSIFALVAIAAVSTGAHATSTVVGNAYAVTVKTNFGTHFSDCYRFDSAGNMTIGTLGALTYTVNFRDTSYFSAVTPLKMAKGIGEVIAFAGKPNGTKIKLIGSDEYGDSYYITGVISSCSAVRNTPGVNPYRR